ncbi:hypothetical protein HCN44_007466 [Aphidius gifuensis]|uniref:Uncharacterized protein n=2 Tax=Aphidius gifuensis TaxID=684658 RepID=A0A834XLZ0_APHGI|nr:hypothetical protein HCN44_007466 [Aphidius gifuensis]
MKEFDTNMYNNVCMISSIIGIFGAIYQILPRQVLIHQHRWQNFSSYRARNIIIWLAVADFFASLGVFVRSLLWINFKNIMPTIDDTSSIIFCVISSAWTEYFYMVTWIWTLCYAIDMKLLLIEKPSRSYHLFAWTFPGLLTIIGLTILYYPDANCHGSVNLKTALLKIMPNYIATYGLMTFVMIVNPILYNLSNNDIHKAVTCNAGQITRRERKIFKTIKLKFALTNIVFLICWLPNLINGILLWILWFNLPVKIVIILWYIMAITNPLQAFFNAIVYQSWGKNIIFQKLLLFFNKNHDDLCEANEISPLLTMPTNCGTTNSSINNSSSF